MDVPRGFCVHSFRHGGGIARFGKIARDGMRLDHIAVAAATLDRARPGSRRRWACPCGRAARHARMGTWNRLLSLGPDEYLEVVAIDPAAPPPGRPRWFALDAFAGPPRMTNWVVALRRSGRRGAARRGRDPRLRARRLSLADGGAGGRAAAVRTAPSRRRSVAGAASGAGAARPRLPPAPAADRQPRCRGAARRGWPGWPIRGWRSNPPDRCISAPRSTPPPA